MTTDLLNAITTGGGFTYNPATDLLIEVGSVHGYAIAIPGTERHLGKCGVTREQFAEQFANLLSDPLMQVYLKDGALVGGWYSPEKDVYMIELSDIWDVPRDIAVSVGKYEGQEAIFDLYTGEEIPTGGTGDAVAAA